MSILDEWFGPWAEILGANEVGERVQKQKILKLLRSDTPVPDNAKPFLAGVLAGDIPLVGGDISLNEERKASIVLRYVLLRDYLDAGRTDISSWDSEDRRAAERERDRMKVQGWPSKPHTLARRIIAERYNIHPDTLKNWIDELLPGQK